MNGPDLDFRFSSAHRFFLSVTSPPWGSSWERGLEAYARGDLTNPESLALIHPNSLLWTGRSREDHQGGTKFKEPQPLDGSCVGERVYGYPCPMPPGTPVHRDHIFPHAMGGPTVPLNCQPLCELHNQHKGMDIHLFPWEEGTPPWLEAYLDSIARRFL